MIRRVGLLLTALLVVGSLAVAQEKPVIKLGSVAVPKPVAATLPTAHTGPQQAASNATAVDLSPFFPKPGFQGNQNSCVAWATAYAMKSYQEQVERSGQPFGKDSLTFSPSFIYNQINHGKDEGSTLSDAGALLQKIGVVPMTVMPYTDNFRMKPTDAQLSQAAAYKAASFQLLKPDAIDVMKDFLRQGIPIVIGMEVYQNFEDYKGGVFKTTVGGSLGGHAMCILGFDDSKKAFKLINSWSTQWGEGGYGWVDYTLFAKINKSAMIVKDNIVPPPSKPGVPSGVQAGKGLSGEYVQVDWQSSPGAEGYSVFRSTDPKKSFAELGLVKGTTYLDKSAKLGTMYYYAIKSAIGDSTSDFSEAAQGFLQAKPGVGIPSQLAGDSDGKRVKLRWQPVSGALGYRVYRYIEEKDSFGKIGQTANPAFADPSVAGKPGTYYYLVTAYNKDKESPNSDSVSIVVSPAVVLPLVSPKNLVASEGDFSDRVEMSWDSVPGAQQYVILKYNDDSGAWKITDGVKTTSWTDKNPGPGRTFYAVVSRVGDTLSPLEDFVTGYITSFGTKVKPKQYADQAYFGQYNSKEAKQGKDSWYDSGTFFADPKDFFSNFKPQDFFFVDEAKFFAVDPDFFKVPDGFFTKTDDFFGK